MKKIILTVILVLGIVVIALGSKCASASDKDGNQYRVLSECKHSNIDSWVQWIDYAAPGKKLTGGCVFASYFRLDGKNLTMTFYDCMEALMIITNYCVRNNIPVDDYIHSAL